MTNETFRTGKKEFRGKRAYYIRRIMVLRGVTEAEAEKIVDTEFADAIKE